MNRIAERRTILTGQHLAPTRTSEYARGDTHLHGRALTIRCETTELNEERTSRPEHLSIYYHRTPREQHVNPQPRARACGVKEAEAEPARSQAR